MSKCPKAGLIACLFSAAFLTNNAAPAQTITPTPSIALKNGETAELFDAYFISTLCRSLLIGTPPPEVTLTIKAGPVVPRRQGCAKEVPGGTIVATATNVKESKIEKLFYRVKYKTKEGDRQTANGYYVGLFP